MINKYRNGIVLRDLIFMIVLFSGIVAISSIVVSDFGDVYDNNNMSSEFNSDSIGEETLNETVSNWEEIGQKLSGDQGIIAFASGSLEAIGTILLEAVKAPITFANILESVIYSTVPELGGDSALISIIKYIVIGLIYILVIFSIVTAFLQGGKI